ncbi:MAG: hypothetical protein ABSH19_02605 [Opitutales bacterium]
MLATAMAVRPATANAADSGRSPEPTAKAPLAVRKAPQAVARRPDLV